MRNENKRQINGNRMRYNKFKKNRRKSGNTLIYV